MTSNSKSKSYFHFLNPGSHFSSFSCNSVYFWLDYSGKDQERVWWQICKSDYHFLHVTLQDWENHYTFRSGSYNISRTNRPKWPYAGLLPHQLKAGAPLISPVPMVTLASIAKRTTNVWFPPRLLELCSVSTWVHEAFIPFSGDRETLASP